MSHTVVYVLGTESSGKTDLVRQLEYLSAGKLRTAPTKCTPTMGQEVTQLTLPSATGGTAVTVELRELGGSVVNTWESFVLSRTAQASGDSQTLFLLLYVVDAAATHQLPLASTMFRYLTGGDAAACAGWPALIVLQKCACVEAMTCAEVQEYFGDGKNDDALCVVEADSWNGVGVGDVLDWLAKAVATR